MFFFGNLYEKWSQICIKNDENRVLKGSRGGLGSSCGALGAQEWPRLDFDRFLETFCSLQDSILGGFCVSWRCLGGHLVALKSIAEKALTKSRFLFFSILDPLKLWIIYRRGIKNSKIAHSRQCCKTCLEKSPK